VWAVASPSATARGAVAATILIAEKLADRVTVLPLLGSSTPKPGLCTGEGFSRTPVGSKAHVKAHSKVGPGGCPGSIGTSIY
jgi:hypothetical protein